jgi:hypothetical protein
VTLEYALPGETNSDVLMSAKGMELDRDRLVELATALTNWIELPLDELGRTPLALDIDLSSRSDQSLVLAFGGRDAPAGRGQVGCLVTVSSDRFASRLPLITDPAALSIFSDGLREAEGVTTGHED